MLFRIPIFIFAAVGAFSGCGSNAEPVEPVATVSDNPAAERLFKEARDLFEAGDLDMSRKALDSFLTDFPDDPLVGDVTIYLSRIMSLRDEHQAALDLLASLRKKGGSSPAVRRAGFYEGVFLFRLGECGRAIEKLKPFIGHMTKDDENLLLLDTLWRSARATGDMFAQVIWMNSYLEADPPSGDAGMAIQELGSLVGSIIDKGMLRKLSKELNPEGQAWPLVMARVVILEVKDGMIEEAGEILAKVEAKGRGDEPAVVKAADVFESGQRVELDAVGCILPLSGRARLVGEEILKGVMLAAKRVRIGEDQVSMSVVIRDSGGVKEKAVAAVEEMVGKEHVAGIVGPVDGAVSKIAAAKAAELGVPTILLTMKEGIASVGDPVFRRFASGSLEIEALIDAAARLGGEKWGVLFSDDGYGRSMKDAFSRALLNRGLQTNVSVGFDPSKKDFVEEAAKLASEEFDVLLVAARASQLALIAPALAAEGIWSVTPGEKAPVDGRGVQLLVPSSGMSADLPRRAGRYLQGAIFTSYFFEDASNASARFAEIYRDQYSREPTYYAAFGYDSVILLAAAARAGVNSRAQIAKWLAGSGRSESDQALVVPLRGFSKEGEPLGTPWTIILKGDTWEILP